jgi:hypothetical protein
MFTQDVVDMRTILYQTICRADEKSLKKEIEKDFCEHRMKRLILHIETITLKLRRIKLTKKYLKNF